MGRNRYIPAAMIRNATLPSLFMGANQDTEGSKHA
jgi:hypothetical protein